MPHTLLFSSDLFLSFFFVFFLTLCSFQFSPGSIWEKVLVAGHSIGFVALKWVMTHSLKNTDLSPSDHPHAQSSYWIQQEDTPALAARKLRVQIPAVYAHVLKVA